MDYRFLEPDWLIVTRLDEYLSAEFLVLAVVGLGRASSPGVGRGSGTPRSSRSAHRPGEHRRDSQLWRLEVAYEYRRVVYPLGLALALLVGPPSRGSRGGRSWCPLVPRRLRLLRPHVDRAPAPAAAPRGAPRRVVRARRARLRRDRIDGGELPDTGLVVTDECLHFVVPYLVERPTIAAFEEWQVGFENRLPRPAGPRRSWPEGRKGRRLATELKAGYVVVDPRCRPNPAQRSEQGRSSLRTTTSSWCVSYPAR